ncbi:hypothetical protein OUZ56_015152 [Daphnia magna]|uniref:Uncharacterized protein n=1 Tax=Daphnia magna TaxID=35525 RepID=A0ABR0AM01_9CRUS|nr:hypothetical protein OUZ56_015152 [Daphnia magna]
MGQALAKGAKQLEIPEKKQMEAMLESRNRPAWMTHALFDEQSIPSLEHLVLCAWNFAIYTCREENKQPYVRHGKIKYATINNSYEKKFEQPRVIPFPTRFFCGIQAEFSEVFPVIYYSESI